MSGHGHVTPNPNGTLAKCGGPSLCKECARELAALAREEATSPVAEPERFRGVIVIEWPPPGPSPYSALNGWGVVITDAVTGKPVRTCSHADIVVHADAGQPVTADLTLFTDADGEPVLDGVPVIVREGEFGTGTFPFAVAGMRVRQ